MNWILEGMKTPFITSLVHGHLLMILKEKAKVTKWAFLCKKRTFGERLLISVALCVHFPIFPHSM